MAAAMPWADDATERLDELVAQYPVIARISAAKTLRDKAEQAARATGHDIVSPQHLPANDRRKPKGEAA
jgi:chlorophyllide a reductase subunit Z